MGSPVTSQAVAEVIHSSAKTGPLAFAMSEPLAEIEAGYELHTQSATEIQRMNVYHQVRTGSLD